MSINEYLIKCPECMSETRLVAEESNPIIYFCQGCERSVVVQGSAIYTVSQAFMDSIIHKYNTRPCGRLIGAILSEDSEQIITSSKIQHISSLLDQTKDVSEFIKKIT